MLDTSDNEEEVVPKQKQVKSEGKSTVKSEPKSTAAASKDEKTQKKATDKGKEVAAVKKNDAPAVAPDAGEAGKDNNRGGRVRGKEGNKRGEKKFDHDGNKLESFDGKKGSREFDRRSGTGRGKEVSRGGRGPYNSGNPNQEAQDAEKDPKRELLESTPVVDDEEANAENAEAAEVEEPKIKTVSIDDYLRLKEEARANSKLLSVQQSVRPVASQGGTRLTKKVVEEAVNGNGKGNDKKVTEPTTGTVFELGFKFNNPAPSREPRFRDGDRPQRGGRGDDRRKTGGRGEGRGERRPQGPSAAVNKDDFPALK